MKKLLVLGLFLGLAGSSYALEKLDITTGMYIESENHNATYNSSDVTVHGFLSNPPTYQIEETVTFHGKLHATFPT